MTSISCFCKDAFTYNPEDFSRSKIYQEILLEDDYIKKRFLHKTPAIFWASLPPSLGFAGSDFLGKSLCTWTDYGGTKE